MKGLKKSSQVGSEIIIKIELKSIFNKLSHFIFLSIFFPFSSLIACYNETLLTSHIIVNVKINGSYKKIKPCCSFFYYLITRFRYCVVIHELIGKQLKFLFQPVITYVGWGTLDWLLHLATSTIIIITVSYYVKLYLLNTILNSRLKKKQPTNDSKSFLPALNFNRRC